MKTQDYAEDYDGYDEEPGEEDLDNAYSDGEDNGLYNAKRLSRNAFDNLAQRAHQRRIRANILMLIFAVLTIIIFTVACVSLFFRVKNISIEGETRYDPDNVIIASGISYGDNLYSVDRSASETLIYENCPYIGYISIRRVIPDTIKITISEELPRYYFELSGEYFVLSETLRVLDRTENMAGIMLDFPNIIKLNTENIKRAVVGEQIVFDNEGYYSYAQEMLSTFLNSDISRSISLIDFSNRFSIFVIYQDRLKIEFGDIEKIDVKLAFAMGIIDKLTIKDEGIVNVENDTGFYKIAAIKDTY